MDKMNFGNNPEVKVGDEIKILFLDDIRGVDYIGRTGEVTLIDGIGQIHGTWGGLAIIPETDSYELLD
jgi:hypothetical protein